MEKQGIECELDRLQGERWNLELELEELQNEFDCMSEAERRKEEAEFIEHKILDRQDRIREIEKKIEQLERQLKERGRW